MDLGARGGGSSRRFDVDLERRRALPLLKRHGILQDAGAGDRHSLGKQPALFLFTGVEQVSAKRCSPTTWELSISVKNIMGHKRHSRSLASPP